MTQTDPNNKPNFTLGGPGNVLNKEKVHHYAESGLGIHSVIWRDAHGRKKVKNYVEREYADHKMHRLAEEPHVSQVQHFYYTPYDLFEYLHRTGFIAHMPQVTVSIPEPLPTSEPVKQSKRDKFLSSPELESYHAEIDALVDRGFKFKKLYWAIKDLKDSMNK